MMQIGGLPEVRAHLDAKVVTYKSIEQVAPSIEDLFVSAVEGERADRVGVQAS